MCGSHYTIPSWKPQTKNQKEVERFGHSHFYRKKPELGKTVNKKGKRFSLKKPIF